MSEHTEDTRMGWHFVGDRLRDGRPIPADGDVLRHDGPVVICESGLHASERIIDALRFAPGNTICRVEMRDVVASQDDKFVARERVILWRVDGEDVLREFARTVALELLHEWATDDTPDIDTVVEYLLTGDTSLRSAAHWAAHSAAYSAVRSAAYSAAHSAVRSAAYSAVRSAAYSAVRSAVRSAAYSAANDLLARMVEEGRMVSHD